MFDDFKDGSDSRLGGKPNLTFISSKGNLNYTLEELQLSYKIYAENKDHELLQIKNKLKLAFKNAGVEKSEVEIEKFLELASMTRNSTLEVFRRVKNIE